MLDGLEAALLIARVQQLTLEQFEARGFLEHFCQLHDCGDALYGNMVWW